MSFVSFLIVGFYYLRIRSSLIQGKCETAPPGTTFMSFGSVLIRSLYWKDWSHSSHHRPSPISITEAVDLDPSKHHSSQLKAGRAINNSLIVVRVVGPPESGKTYVLVSAR